MPVKAAKSSGGAARRPAAKKGGGDGERPTLLILAIVALVVFVVYRAVTSDTVAVPEKLTGDIRSVHDPAIVKDGDTWYIFSTGWGIPIRRSSDLSHWESIGSVFPDGLPSWVRGQVPDLPRGEISGWAPDISRHDGMWHLYWSIGVFGTSKAVIGHAVSKSLDPGSSDYGWVDQGPIVASGPGSPTMAIDPEAVTDEDGRRWLAWGSFGQGIMLQPLDPATGKFAPGSRAVNLARRDPFFLGVEGADLVRHDDQWYLFVSFGFCCRGVDSNYSIHVGRSKEITGPYLDAAGTPMTANGGTTVTGSYANLIGPGHGSIIENGDDMLLAHHYYDRDDGGRSTLLLRPLIWGPDGWPLSPDAGFERTELDEGDAVGEWHLHDYPEEASGRRSGDVRLTLREGGTVAPMGRWRLAGETVVISDVVIQGQPRSWWLFLDPDTGLVFGRDSRTATIRGLRGQ